MNTLLLLLVVLACPLLMWLMMRGGPSHGQAGHSHGAGGSCHAEAGEHMSVDDLRRRRDELDREIAARESASEDSHDAAVVKT